MEGVAKPHRKPGKRAYFIVTLIAFLLALFPFLFWYGTWFGRRLNDAQITEYLNDAARPRRAQHALVQIGERLSRRDRRATRWYPKVIELAQSPRIELRQTAAWIMGQDHTSQAFHEALLRLLQDPEPMVRRNAALALANFRDAAARPELRAMLRSYSVAAPGAGAVQYRLKAGEYVNPGTLMARIDGAEVRSPVPGEARLLHGAGAAVARGDPLIEILPDKDHAWEALRALLILGEREDLDDVQRFARGVSGMPDRVRQQAILTAREIESRK